MRTSPDGPDVVRFAVFELDLRTHELRKRGVKLKLQEQPMQILALLVARPGDVITREELREKLWPDTHVDFEHGLNTAIKKLREVLDDSASTPRFIETLPRTGYRFISPLAQAATAPTPRTRTVAVLPFDNVCDDHTIDWLGTGLAETLTADLGKLKTLVIVGQERVRQALRARAGTTTATPADIGRDVGADRVVAGSYQRFGDLVRITPRVIAAVSGDLVATGKIDGSWQDLFRMQDRVARDVVAELDVEEHELPPFSPATRHLEAYEHYSRGREKFADFGRHALEAAITHFQRAIDADPQYALAYTALGACYSFRFIGTIDVADLHLAATALERALELDAQQGDAHSHLCYAYLRLGRLEAAIHEGHLAVEVSPERSRPNYFFGVALLAKAEVDPARYFPAVECLRRAVAAGPLEENNGIALGLAALMFGRYADAERLASNVLQVEEAGNAVIRFEGAEWILGTVCLRRGERTAAERFYGKAVQVLETSDRMLREEWLVASECGPGDVALRRGDPSGAMDTYARAWRRARQFPRMLARERMECRALAGMAAAGAAAGNRTQAERTAREVEELLDRISPQRQTWIAHCTLADLYHAQAIAWQRLGEAERVLSCLGRAVKSGWRDAAWLETDSEFAALRGTARFQGLLDEIRAFGQPDFEEPGTIDGASLTRQS